LHLREESIIGTGGAYSQQQQCYCFTMGFRQDGQRNGARKIAKQ
jgi:hypothetical protein